MFVRELLSEMASFLRNQEITKISKKTGITRAALYNKFESSFGMNVPLFIDLCIFYGLKIHKLPNENACFEFHKKKSELDISYGNISKKTGIPIQNLHYWHTTTTITIQQFIILYKYWHEQVQLQKHVLRSSYEAQSRLEEEIERRMG